MIAAADRITAFSLTGKWAILADGQQLPITNMIGADRKDTHDPDLCVSFVCGPRSDGKWLADFVKNFDMKDLD